MPRFDEKSLIQIKSEHLSKKHQHLLNELVKQFSPAFTTSNSDIGNYQIFKVNIQLDLTQKAYQTTKDQNRDILNKNLEPLI